MNTIQDFITLLFEVEVNAHIAHLQTKSYAEHKALNELYEEIVDLRDRFAEAYQGEYGIIKGYKIIKPLETNDFLSYLSEVCNKVELFKKGLDETYLQQICDDISELLYDVKYKLKNLH